jgi:hypothetical protein
MRRWIVTDFTEFSENLNIDEFDVVEIPPLLIVDALLLTAENMCGDL